LRDQAIAKNRKPRRRADKYTPSRGEPEKRLISLRSVSRVFSMLAYFAVLILAGWLLYYSVESPYFAVRNIDVSGSKLLAASQVQDAAGVLGRNALGLQTEAVEQAVLRLSSAREAHAEVTLAGRVVIDVVERTPLVQWQAREGVFLVDRQGVAFGQQPPPSALPLVRDVDGPVMEVGSRIDPAVLTSIEALQGTLPTRAGIQPAWYDYSHSTGVAVPIAGGTRVIFGDASDLDSKLASLAAIREYLDTTKSRAELIDVRFENRPVYVLAPPAPVKAGQPR
jgi:cell division protein FtsQ